MDKSEKQIREQKRIEANKKNYKEAKDIISSWASWKQTIKKGGE